MQCSLQAVGLGLPASDADFAVLGGNTFPDARPEGGFGVKGRQDAATELHKLLLQMCRTGLASKNSLEVIIARVPVLKGTITLQIPEAAVVDALNALDKELLAWDGSTTAAGTSGSIASTFAASISSIAGQFTGLSAAVAMLRHDVSESLAASAEASQTAGNRFWAVNLPVDISLGSQACVSGIEELQQQVGFQQVVILYAARL